MTAPEQIVASLRARQSMENDDVSARAADLIVALSRPQGEGELREALTRAYEQGCIDTHKSVQAEPELALMQPEWCEFGEAADDYAAHALSNPQQGTPS